MGKIYGKTGTPPVRVRKKRNEHNRHRDIIVNFRVSKEEKEILDSRIATTGMGKQDYYRQSCLYQKILVKGNVKTFDTIKDMVKEINDRLTISSDITTLSPEQTESLKTILQILNYLYGGDDHGRLS